MSNGIILILGNNEAPANYPDNTYKFRQDSSFVYFFGHSHPGYAGIIDIDNDKDYFFGNDVDMDDIIWMGPQPSVKELAAQVGVEKSYPFDMLKEIVGKAIAQRRKIHFLPPYRYDNMMLLEDLTGIRASMTKQHASLELIKAVVSLRSVKEECEIAEIDKACGASKLYIEDVIDEFCDDYIVPCVQAHAVYENKYLLGTSMARPLIAKKLVEIARKEGAVAICHGATGKGNDQIRFELGIKALAPDIKIIAPWRSDKWNMDSRESEIEYCKAHGIHLPFSTDSSYSRDRNIWHISHEGLELEDPGNEPNYEHLLVLGVTPEKAPDEGEYVTMTFEKGVPTSVNGEKMKVSDIIRTLNKLGGKHGIGIVDIVENRVVGMKSRGVYETPGGTILMEAHQQLEELILDRDTYAFEKEMGAKFASLVYEGKWFTPLREAEQPSAS
jgi:argininosuccinate synthase